MRAPRVPPPLIGDTASMASRFVVAAQERGIHRETADTLFETLGDELAATSCFLDQLKGLWRYDFGWPIDLPEGTVVYGTQMFTPVKRLVDVLMCAHERLSQPKYQEYVRRLDDQSRHQDVLAEMIPLLPVDPDVSADFEVLAETGEDRTIDWHLRREGKPDVLFDVKHRLVDLIEYLSNISRNQMNPEPSHDTASLFRSTIDKFAAHSPTRCIHGVWVITELKQEATELRSAFDALDLDRLHFAVIANWKRDCHLLARDGVDREGLVRLLKLSESDALVFHRDAGRR